MECSIKNCFFALFFMLFVLSVKSEEKESYSFKPTKYELKITTTAEHFEDPQNKAAANELTYDGEVDIFFDRVGTITDAFQIILNTNPKGKIISHEVTDVSGTVDTTPLCKLKEGNPIGDKLIFLCKKEAKTIEKFKIHLKFTNPFGDDMTGFYRSSYKEKENNKIVTKWLLTTHFEPIFARKAFPCFDDPKLKAKFKINIITPTEKEAVLSNTKKITGSKSYVDGPVTHTFQETEIPISTYLVAFTVSDLEGTPKKIFKSGYAPKPTELPAPETERELKTYGRKDIIEKNEAELSQKFGIEAVNELTKYLGVGYALQKIDHVGIPDFSAGAMENFGHVSFREKSLFFNEATGTAATKQANILTITHELVHQWFGNLVTLESWDYIWLNEAFANYIEYIIASKFKDTSNWNLLNQMVVNEIHLRAFETDGLDSSTPLSHHITDENLIFSFFNDIPYSKGAAVLRMWNLQIENDGFQKALKKYLVERREDTANPDQLFSYFKSETGMKQDNFKSWTLQPGYPVVEVKKNKENYTLTQTRFYWEKKHDDKAVWQIPITYRCDNTTSVSTVPAAWLSKEPLTINLPKCKWIIVNNEQAGYYRVNYDKENWNALAEALKAKEHSNIHELNRAQIINDAFSLARSLQGDYVEYSIAFSLAKYLEKESSFVPWKTALNALEFVRTKIYDQAVNKKFKEYVTPLIKPHFVSLKSEKLDHIGKLKNVEISRWACSLDLESCVNEAKDIFNKTTYAKYPDTQEIILCTVVRVDEKAWDKVWEECKKTEDSALRLMYLSALGCGANEAKIKTLLEDSISDSSSLRKQDRMYALSSVYNGNLNNTEVAFKFIQDSYEGIAKKYGGINPLGKALIGIAKKLKTKDQVEKLKALETKIAAKPELAAAKESAKNAVNIAESNVKWVDARMKQVTDYLNSGSFLSYSIALLSLSLLTVFQF